MSREIETEVYREGGLNTEVHIFPKAFSGERVLRMEKGAYSGEEHIFCMPGERLDGVLNLVGGRRAECGTKQYFDRQL